MRELAVSCAGKSGCYDKLGVGNVANLVDEREPKLANGLALGEVSGICVAIWRQKPTMETFAAQKAVLERTVRRRGRGTAFLCIVEPTAEPPEADVRRASAAMIREHSHTLACVACVIEGGGFSAAITRSVLSGMALLARETCPVAYLANVGEAATWIGARATTMTSLRDLQRGVEALRLRLATPG